jgi:hypothetical protein
VAPTLDLAAYKASLLGALYNEGEEREEEEGDKNRWV